MGKTKSWNELERIIRENYKIVYADKLDNLGKIDKCIEIHK